MKLSSIATRMSCAVTAVIALGILSPANAIVVDFDSFAPDTIITNQIPEFTVTPDPGGNVVILDNDLYAFSNPNSLANENVSFLISFTNPVENLSFRLSAEEDPLDITIMHFGGTTNFVVPFDGNHDDNDLIDLGAFQEVSSLYFDTTSGSTNDGITLDHFVFDLAATNVPAPGALAMLGLGLAGFGFLRRRARR